MGIVDCFTLCNRLIEKAESTTNKRLLKNKNHYRANKLPCNIYIDGSSVWFVGYPNNSPNKEKAHQKLNDILCHIKNSDYLIINSVTICFNGKYPALKCKPLFEYLQSSEVHEWCNELLYCKTVNDIEFLDVGEAVGECFFQRDRKFASMIVTNESDILPICYKYNRKTQNDKVFCYLAHRKAFYNTNYLTTNLNRNAFVLLLFLRGSDKLIEPLFSFTMVNNIFELLRQNIPYYNLHFNQINTIMQEVNQDNIEKCIVYFIWIMVDAKQCSLGSFKWPSLSASMQSGNYLEIMEWTITYSKFGKNVYNFHKNFKVLANDESKFDFIFKLCTNVFPHNFKSCWINTFQHIENIMESIRSYQLFCI